MPIFTPSARQRGAAVARAVIAGYPAAIPEEHGFSAPLADARPETCRSLYQNGIPARLGHRKAAYRRCRLST
jgi:hypothetical protein